MATFRAKPCSSLISNVQNDAEKIVAALAEAECEFIIVGGISAVMNGATIVIPTLEATLQLQRELGDA